MVRLNKQPRPGCVFEILAFWLGITEINNTSELMNNYDEQQCEISIRT